MKETLIYVAGEEIFVRDGERRIALRSSTAEKYRTKLRAEASRKEWKTKGESAMFQGTFDPSADVETRLANLSCRITDAGRWKNDILYAMNLDGAGSIFRRSGVRSAVEGIVLGDGRYCYEHFDLKGDEMVLSARLGAESHIATLTLPESGCEFLTDGHTVDREPVFSKTEDGVIYFSSAGLPAQDGEEAPSSHGGGIPGMWQRMEEMHAPEVRGPSAILRMDTLTRVIDTVLESPDTDYLHPKTGKDGSLYYVKRPYAPVQGAQRGGCLRDIFLFPVRLFRALFGFLNFFSMRYSGDPLSAGNAKTKTEGQLFLDGNLIEAERALKENRKRGERNPGIIPRNWELHRKTPDGRDELVARCVLAYEIVEGGVVYSNGTHLILKDGEGETVLDRVEKIRAIHAV